MTRAASATARETTVPIQIADRAPATWASQPTSGAPIGFVPMNTRKDSAMTRPRYAGSVPSWSRGFAAWAR